MTGADAPNPMVPRLFRIRRVTKETYNIFSLELKPENGSKEFSFAPGQFNMLYIFGVGEAPMSISGDPDKTDTLVHTIRVVGKVTKAMQGMKAGELLGVRGPYGSHWPLEEAMGKDVVIVAGGVGLPPLRPAIYQLLAHREQYGTIVLLYGTRSPSDILYRRELEQWRGRFDFEVELTVDQAPRAWRGNVGVVTTLIPKALFDPDNTIAMICGPEIMMRYTVLALRNRGVDSEHIFVSMERHMKCGIGHCGRCQFGPTYICKDGPVLRHDRVKPWCGRREI